MSVMYVVCRSTETVRIVRYRMSDVRPAPVGPPSGKDGLPDGHMAWREQDVSPQYTLL